MVFRVQAEIQLTMSVLLYRSTIHTSSFILRKLMSTSTQPGPIEACMTAKLKDQFKPTSLKIKNDSHKHAHHAGIRGATNTTESHFQIEIVSDEFEGKNMPTRHRMVYQLLSDELQNKGVHALQMKTKTPAEFSKTNQ